MTSADSTRACVLLAYVLLVSAVVFPNCVGLTRDSEASLDEENLMALTRSYIESAGSQRGKTRSRALRQQLSVDCKIRIAHLDLLQVLTVDEFSNHLERLSFVENIKRIVLREPEYEFTDSEAGVSYVEYLRTGKGDYIVECNLRIRIIDGKLRIVRIDEKCRAATSQETETASRITRQKPYNPREGFGARYLGGAIFGGTRPRFSPDRSTIVFASLRHESSEIYLVDLETKHLARLTHTPFWEIRPAFTPDGTEIVFESDEADYYGDSWFINVDGSNRRRMILPGRSCREATFSTDGEQIALVCGVEGQRSIWVKRVRGSSFERVSPLNSDCFGVNFSTDSETIVFVERESDQTRTYGLGVCSIDGSKRRHLALHMKIEHTIGLVSDSEKMYFVALDQEYHPEVWSFQLGDQTCKRVLTGGNLSTVNYALSADGRHLYFLWDSGSKYEYELYVLELDRNSEPNQLTHEQGYISGFSLSPDGKDIVFVLQPKYATKRGKGWICTIPSNRGKVRRICKNY